VHSGDSTAVMPPMRVTEEQLDRMRDIARRLALRLGVVGLMNVQFALHQGKIYVLEVNPRASRTAPFIAKAVGLPLVAVACRVMAGLSLAEAGLTAEPPVIASFVKVPVFPFRRFPDVDPILGPEMKSTGEVMGIATDFGAAYAKGWLAAGHRLPVTGRAFLSVRDQDKAALWPVARRLHELGFSILATAGTAASLEQHGLTVSRVLKVHEGRPNVADLLINREIDLVINTPSGKTSIEDDTAIRRTALRYDVPCITNLSGARAFLEAIDAYRRGRFSVMSLQELHARPGVTVGGA
jgi:carbamoyl-phosphate synthase large subunit